MMTNGIFKFQVPNSFLKEKAAFIFVILNLQSQKILISFTHLKNIYHIPTALQTMILGHLKVPIFFSIN